jgi:hypothetical protein
MQEVLRQNFPTSQPALVLFDQATFAAIQTLGKSGVLTFREDMGQLLYRSPHYGELHATEREQQRQDAQKYLSVATRKMAMATLLASGQFLMEALSPAQEALTLGMKVLSTLKMTPASDLIDLQSHLASEPSPGKAEALLQSAREGLEEISQKMTQYTLG